MFSTIMIIILTLASGFILWQMYKPQVLRWAAAYPGVKPPEKGSAGAACHDVYAYSVDYFNNSPMKYIIDTGIVVEPPPGYRVNMYLRSSMAKQDWTITNCLGVIDGDYRGTLKAIVTYVGNRKLPSEFPYKPGDRCLQMELVRDVRTELREEHLNGLSGTSRGDGGFGSTGK